MARREEDFLSRPAHHSYGCGINRLLFQLVLHGAASFRGASACLKWLAEFLPVFSRRKNNCSRGYEQDMLGPIGDDGNPTGGNAFICGNAELRSYLGRGLGIVAFLDGGNVWQKVQDIKLDSIKYTIGLGLRYNTPVGPIRVDYGHNLDRENGESSGEVHFSIGHAF